MSASRQSLPKEFCALELFFENINVTVGLWVNWSHSGPFSGLFFDIDVLESIGRTPTKRGCDS